MKYDVLEKVKNHLYKTRPPNTARTYYSALKKLFRNHQFNDPSEIDATVFESSAKLFRNKSQFSAVKNAIKAMQEVYPDIKAPTEEWFKTISIKKRNYTTNPAKTIYLEPMKRSINQISSDKLKLAYRLALISGLRVSELADLEARDINFIDGKIYVDVRHGKGDKYGHIECKKDDYLCEKLQDYISLCPKEKLFYSEAYMRRCAKNLNMECHDMRRVYAITRREELRQEMSAQQADEQVRQDMRHVRFSTTKRYLYNRKLKMKKEKVGH